MQILMRPLPSILLVQKNLVPCGECGTNSHKCLTLRIFPTLSQESEMLAAFLTLLVYTITSSHSITYSFILSAGSGTELKIKNFKFVVPPPHFCPSLPFSFDFLVDKDVNLCSNHIKPILGGFPMKKVKIILVTILLIFLNIFGLIAFLILYFRNKNKGKVIYRKK